MGFLKGRFPGISGRLRSQFFIVALRLCIRHSESPFRVAASLFYAKVWGGITFFSYVWLLIFHSSLLYIAF
jgi:hypothetical protein